MNFFDAAKNIQKEIQCLPLADIGYQSLETRQQSSVQISKLIENESQRFDNLTQTRIHQEFLGCGPLESLMLDEQITEIIVNSRDNLWFEKHGQLHFLADAFSSSLTFENFVDRMCQEAKIQTSLERPFADGVFRNFRIHIVANPVSPKSVTLTFRRQSENPWTLNRLASENWCKTEGLEILRQWIHNKYTFLVVGETGSGKTSVLSSCLQEMPPSERVLILEDTSEIPVPNLASTKLLTRTDVNGILPEITLTELVRQSLRMRPDRLVVGEVRGSEAKDLLLALSTGHQGSLGTLHASSAHQALFRLEMLVQLGAPQWSLETIRRLLKVSLHGLIVVGRNDVGERKLISIHEISSVEQNGLLIDCVYENT